MAIQPSKLAQPLTSSERRENVGHLPAPHLAVAGLPTETLIQQVKADRREVDPEEAAWAQLLGSEEAIFRKLEEPFLVYTNPHWECYVRSEGEIYNFIVGEDRDKNWDPLNNRQAIIDQLKHEIEWYNADRFYGSFLGKVGIHEIRIQYSQRQLSERFRKEQKNLEDYYYSSSSEGRARLAEPLRRIVASLQESGGQSHINRLFLKTDHLCSFQSKKGVGGYESPPKYSWLLCSFLLPYVTFDTRELALHVFENAIVRNQTELADRCLAAYPDLIQENRSLFWAIECGNLKLARSLIERGMSVKANEVSGAFGFLVAMVEWQKSPLTETEQQEIFEFAEFLAAQGATLEMKIVVEEISTDFSLMQKMRNPLMQRLFLFNMKIYFESYPEAIREQKFLLWAIHMGNLEFARFLVERGISPTAFKGDEGPLDLLFIMVNNHEESLNEAEREAVLVFTKFLLDNGATSTRQVNVSRVAIDKLSFVEAAYFSPSPLAKRMSLICMEHGSRVGSRVAYDMKLQLREHPEYARVLLKHRLLTQEEVDILLAEKAVGEPTTLLEQALQANLYLESRFRRGFINPELVPMAKIIEIRELKKELKMSPDAQVQKQYERLKANYHRLALQHKVLKELSALREEVKKEPEKPSQRVVRFYALFSTGAVPGSSKGKVYWRDMVLRVLQKARVVEEDRFLRPLRILWMHGTKSLVRLLLRKTGALEPLGEMLGRGVAPPCGEIMNDTGVNKEHLSGEIMTSSWEEEHATLFGASTRLLISILYASKESGFRKMGFNLEETWQRILKNPLQNFEEYRKDLRVNRDVDFIQALAEGDDPDGTLWANLRVDILRLRMMDPEADQKLAFLKADVEARLAQGDKNSIYLQRILAALTVPITVTYSSEDLIYLQDPYPIVFASTTAVTEPNGNGQEYLHKGKAVLGKDIQIAFTLPEKVEELRLFLEPIFGIRVYDFETAHYLEMVQMAEGSARREDLGEFLQRFILPESATLFPAQPTYLNADGIRFRLEDPLYSQGIRSHGDYVAKVEAGEILSRFDHGPLHAGRTALWTQVIGKPQQLVGRALFLVGVAGGAHDWARQDEGPDRWDLDSAQKLRNRLLALGYPLEEVTPLVHAIAEKDPPKRNFTTLPQKIVHDADTLEIIRCLESVSDFSKEELVLPLEDDLLAEIQEFILLTESMKKELEMSENIFASLVTLIQTNDRFLKIRTIINGE